MLRYKFECPHCQGVISFSLRAGENNSDETVKDSENLKTLVDLIDHQNQKIKEAKSILESVKNKKKELLKQYLEESRQTENDYEIGKFFEETRQKLEDLDL